MSHAVVTLESVSSALVNRIKMKLVFCETTSLNVAAMSSATPSMATKLVEVRKPSVTDQLLTMNIGNYIL